MPGSEILGEVLRPLRKVRKRQPPARAGCGESARVRELVALALSSLALASFPFSARTGGSRPTVPTCTRSRRFLAAPSLLASGSQTPTTEWSGRAPIVQTRPRHRHAAGGLTGPIRFSERFVHCCYDDQAVTAGRWGYIQRNLTKASRGDCPSRVGIGGDSDGAAAPTRARPTRSVRAPVAAQQGIGPSEILLQSRHRLGDHSPMTAQSRSRAPHSALE